MIPIGGKPKLTPEQQTAQSAAKRQQRFDQNELLNLEKGIRELAAQRKVIGKLGETSKDIRKFVDNFKQVTKALEAFKDKPERAKLGSTFTTLYASATSYAKKLKSQIDQEDKDLEERKRLESQTKVANRSRIQSEKSAATAGNRYERAYNKYVEQGVKDLEKQQLSATKIAKQESARAIRKNQLDAKAADKFMQQDMKAAYERDPLNLLKQAVGFGGGKNAKAQYNYNAPGKLGESLTDVAEWTRDAGAKFAEEVSEAGRRYLKSEQIFERRLEANENQLYSGLGKSVSMLPSFLRGPSGFARGMTGLGRLTGAGIGGLSKAGQSATMDTAGAIATGGMIEAALAGMSTGGLVASGIGAAAVGGYELWKKANKAILPAYDNLENLASAGRIAGINTPDIAKAISGNAADPTGVRAYLQRLNIKTPSEGAAIIGAYGLPRDFEGILDLAAQTAQSKNMNFMNAGQWGGFLGQMSGFGLASGVNSSTSMVDDLQNAITKGISKGIPSKQTFDSINKSLQAIASTGAISSYADIVSMATRGNNLAPIGLRTGDTQAQAATIFSGMLGNITGNPLGFNEFLAQYQKINGTTIFSAEGINKMQRFYHEEVTPFNAVGKNLLKTWGNNPAIAANFLKPLGVKGEIYPDAVYQQMIANGKSPTEALGYTLLQFPDTATQQVILAKYGGLPSAASPYTSFSSGKRGIKSAADFLYNTVPNLMGNPMGGLGNISPTNISKLTNLQPPAPESFDTKFFNLEEARKTVSDDQLAQLKFSNILLQDLGQILGTMNSHIVDALNVLQSVNPKTLWKDISDAGRGAEDISLALLGMPGGWEDLLKLLAGGGSKKPP